MNGMIGMASLLHDTELTPRQREYLDTIESSGRSLLTIINDILDYSKIEAGRIDLEEAVFNLRQCIEDVIDLFATTAGQKGIELIHAISEEAPAWVVGDVTRIRQILVNLVGNALKFTARGEVVIEVRAVSAGSDRLLHFSVRDTGIGIPADRMDRLFKLFSQVDSSTTRKFGGTGLGLAISHRLATVMGGRMWADSVEHQGSTFHFTVAVREPSEPRVAATALVAPTVVSSDLGQRCPLKLLLADDNAVNLRVAEMMLHRLGYRTDIVGNGREVLEACARTAYDLILLDVEMPELDGLEVARRIRAMDSTQGVRPWIVAVTANAMQEDRTRAIAAGMNDFVAKPFRLQELAEALERAHTELAGQT